jgi:hypothetical protein
MTRVLVVHHDIDLSDQEVDSLRRRGYDARQCLGPIGTSCPILSGLECSLAIDADVLVYDAFVTGEPEGARALIEGMREMHPEVPIVPWRRGWSRRGWRRPASTRSRRSSGRPTGERLAEAIRNRHHGEGGSGRTGLMRAPVRPRAPAQAGSGNGAPGRGRHPQKRGGRCRLDAGAALAGER